jgi:ABC-type transport system substrate-binding protein
MKNFITTLLILIFLLTACASASTSTSLPVPASQTPAPPATDTVAASPPTETFTPIPTFTSAPTETPTNTPFPVVESLKATVKADLLSCRYGPGAEYLYLYGLRKGANIELIGRADGNNWVMVKGKSKCWINAKYVDIQGDPKALNILYPEGYKLPVSPYYSPTTVLSAVRDPSDRDKITVTWLDITLHAGDEEDADMFIYLIEVWRCEGRKMIFDPLASNYPEVTFVDEAGCSVPSHGRVFFQEKHGFAGPSEIPWPAR